MNNKKFYEKLKNFQVNLEKQYLRELKKEIINLNDYKKFSLLFVDEETINIIKQIFIDKFSYYKIGDKFQKVETRFYKSEELISRSIIWKIYDISIFYNTSNNNYEFTYYCVDANDNYFPKRNIFVNLKDVDTHNGKFRIKYQYDKK